MFRDFQLVELVDFVAFLLDIVVCDRFVLVLSATLQVLELLWGQSGQLNRFVNVRLDFLSDYVALN